MKNKCRSVYSLFVLTLFYTYLSHVFPELDVQMLFTSLIYFCNGSPPLAATYAVSVVVTASMLCVAFLVMICSMNLQGYMSEHVTSLEKESW